MKLKKIIVIAFILLLTSSIFSAEYGVFITDFNPSAQDMAFGLMSGTANVKNTNPLSIWSNPAKLAYHKEFSLGILLNSKYNEKSNFNNRKLYSSYLSLGYNDFGILIPSYNFKNNFGTEMVYGIDSENYSSESSQAWGFGLRLLKNLCKLGDFENLQNFNNVLELSFGCSLRKLKSKMDYDITPNENFYTYGLLMRFIPTKLFSKNSYFFAETVLGLNSSKNEANNNYDFPSYNQLGTSLLLGYKNFFLKNFLNHDYYLLLRKISKNLISFYFENNILQYENSDEIDLEGHGFELRILDFAALRKGYYNDSNADIKGTTFGFGFSINYEDKIRLDYNFGKLKTEDSGNQTKSDLMLNFNLLTIIENHFKEEWEK